MRISKIAKKPSSGRNSTSISQLLFIQSDLCEYYEMIRHAKLYDLQAQRQSQLGLPSSAGLRYCHFVVLLQLQGSPRDENRLSTTPFGSRVSPTKVRGPGLF